MTTVDRCPAAVEQRNDVLKAYEVAVRGTSASTLSYSNCTGEADQSACDTWHWRVSVRGTVASHTLPYFIPEPVYLEFMPPEDDVLLAEEQPLPAAVSPTADSPSYITKSDPEEGSKEDDEDLKEDLVDYPIDKDDDDDKEEESFNKGRGKR
ncbi:hypothetical protein Tco_1449782 [Tanacetum coccineum]